MARFYTGGIQDLQKLFEDNLQQIDSKTNEILTTNGEIIASYQRGQAMNEGNKGFRDTGSMIANIKPTPIKLGRSKNLKGIKHLSVYAQGKDDDGVKNATKAFILNYGSHNKDGTQRIHPSHWVTNANKAAESEMFENTRKIFES